MATTSGEPTEGRELALVGKVEMRVALADTDSKLEALIKTFLVPLLLKLASHYLSVRNKVIAVCQHVNTRIKDPTVQLPIAALLKQFKENPNALVRHFDLLYIQQGFERLSVSDRLDLLPIVLKGISKNYEESAKSTASIFNIFLKLLHLLVIPSRGSKEDEGVRSRVGLEDEEDADFVARWLAKLTLFASSPSAAQGCPGLSTDDCDFLQLYGKPETWTPAVSGGLNLTETKVRAARFLASGAFSESQRFLPALYASADTNTRLSDVGSDMLKRATPAMSLEDSQLIDKLFTLYLGSTEQKASPVRPALQMKLLGLLSRSRLAATYGAQIKRIVDAQLPSDATAPGKTGLEATKLRQQAFQFVNWVTRMAPADAMVELAPSLLDNLKSFVQTDISLSEPSSRAQAYECIGSLARSCPQQTLLVPGLELLDWLFAQLSLDSSGVDVSISIEHALSSTISAFAAASDPQIEAELIRLLLRYVHLEAGSSNESGQTVVRSTRYVVVRFSNRCLPFSDVNARLIDVHALSGGPRERSEVLEEGRKGLDPHWYCNLNAINVSGGAEQKSRYSMPDFERLVLTFFGDTRYPETLGHGLVAAIEFCFAVLVHQALASRSKAPAIDVDWNKNIEALLDNDELAQSIVESYLAGLEPAKFDAGLSLKKLVEVAFAGLTDKLTGDEARRVGQGLHRIFSISPDNALKDSLRWAPDLKEVITSNDPVVRSSVSQIFGIMCNWYSIDELSITLEPFINGMRGWRTAVGSGVNQVHGSILAVAYYASHETRAEGAQYSQACIEVMLEILANSRDKELLDAALTAADCLSLFGKVAPTTLEEVQFGTVLGKIEEQAKHGNEKAILVLGHLAMQCPEDEGSDSYLQRIINILYSLHEKRQPELHFAVGSALSCAASGWSSKALVGSHDVHAPLDPPYCSKRTTLDTMVEKVLKDCTQTKPSLRAASVIWLLSLVQYCGHLDPIKNRLRQCQRAFKGFLADRESLNQEAASRGLTIVYERSDKDIRDDLIRDLVGSFTGTQSSLAGRVSEDTELFEPGALPTGEGSSVTTYKDIVNLASEVGDPSLVYRFMSLAANSSIWSSRAAFGRFGLGRILADSGDGYLARNPKLYAALFRYRFDPNSNVRAAMNDIWAAIVTDSAVTIASLFDTILDDLLKNIVNREWRTRQACCSAIADLIQGQPFERYEARLTKIWTMAFKVSDDIKDSVRVAAMELARTLTGILTRSLEAGEVTAKKANAMLEQVLPFLLGPSGLEAGAKEVQMFALATLLDVIKKARPTALRPFLPRLVTQLVALLSSVEPEAVNYLHLNADKYGMTAAEIDDARLSSVRGSPMMEAIERCLDMLDADSMRALDEPMQAAVKTVIGLPSKVGASRIVVSLATRRAAIFTPYADGFLRLLRGQVLDRNDTVSASMAAACGYLARIATQDEILRLVTYAQKLYFDSVDDRHRSVAGELVLAIAKRAADRFSAVGSSVLPFTYFGTHDEHEEARELFKQAWEESVGGSRAVLLYLREIIDLAMAYLEAPSWAIKHASALTVADTVRAAGTGAQISEQDARLIWPVLEKAVSSKTWEGKEKVLDAVVMLAKTSPLLKVDPLIASQLEKIMLREAKRTNKSYKPHAMRAYAEFVDVHTAVDLFAQVYAIVAPVVEEDLESRDRMELDGESAADVRASKKQ